MVFWKLFWRKNNDNYNEDLLNQKRKEVQEEIEAEQKIDKKRKESEEYFKTKMNNYTKNLNKEEIEKIIYSINEFLISFRKHKENFNKEITDEFMLKMLLNKLKEDSIKNINNLFTIFNIDKNSDKDVLEAYNKAIEEIENS